MIRQSLLILASLMTVFSSCFTYTPWSSERKLLQLIDPCSDQDHCEAACMAKKECEAIAYVNMRCALFGADRGRPQSCVDPAAAYYVKTPLCDDTTTTTVPTSTPTTGTTTTSEPTTSLTSTTLTSTALVTTTTTRIRSFASPICISLPAVMDPSINSIREKWITIPMCKNSMLSDEDNGYFIISGEMCYMGNTNSLDITPASDASCTLSCPGDIFTQCAGNGYGLYYAYV